MKVCVNLMCCEVFVKHFSSIFPFMGMISVVTVVKDDLVGLMRTAESILSQTNAEFEWIIVDGFSADGTLEFLHSLPKETRVFQLQPTGIYSAMNFAATQAKGEWIWYLNAGDIFLQTNSISLMIELIGKSQENSIVATPVLHLTSHGYLFSTSIPSISEVGAEFNHQGVAIKRNLFSSIGGFDESLKLAADGKLLDQATKNGNSLLGSPYLVGFELGGESGTRFRETLRETSTYRKKIPWFKRQVLILKNRARFILLDLEKRGLGSELLRTYLSSRQDALVQEIGAADLLTKHIHANGSPKFGLLHCCFDKS